MLGIHKVTLDSRRLICADRDDNGLQGRTRWSDIWKRQSRSHMPTTRCREARPYHWSESGRTSTPIVRTMTHANGATDGAVCGKSADDAAKRLTLAALGLLSIPPT